MKIHREGYVIIAITGAVSLFLIMLTWFFIKPVLLSIFLSLILLLINGLFIWFFRVPTRIYEINNKLVYAPADGKIVVIEETTEHEYFKDKRIQVSVFMSPLNVHVNYYPLSGKVDYVKYHPGKYLVAWHPKSSLENERSSIVLDTDKNKILIRQIAGILARRIITYSQEAQEVLQGNELGFIKFGSRVDIFLPADAKIKVNLNQSSKAMKTVIAELSQE